MGPLDRDPRLRRVAGAPGHGAPASPTASACPGTRTGAALRREYEDADLLVVPSRAETYGMVVPEALAAGVPVLATAVGGIPEAVGRTASGVPGLLVPPDDSAALAAALARWLTDAGLRCRLRRRRAAPEGDPAGLAEDRRRASAASWPRSRLNRIRLQIRVASHTDGGRWA